MSKKPDRIDRAAERLPWQDPRFRLANAWAYLKWLRAEKAKRVKATPTPPEDTSNG